MSFVIIFIVFLPTMCSFESLSQRYLSIEYIPMDRLLETSELVGVYEFTLKILIFIGLTFLLLKFKLTPILLP